MAPNCCGQWRRHVSQLMQIDMSIKNGAFCHFGLRSCDSSRSVRFEPAIAESLPAGVSATLTGEPCGRWTCAVTAARQLTTQGQERKQQLLDCAAKLFAERGYEDTRIIDIVEAAGVAKGLFYWYFPNKEQLFRELAEEIRWRL